MKQVGISRLVHTLLERVGTPRLVGTVLVVGLLAVATVPSPIWPPVRIAAAGLGGLALLTLHGAWIDVGLGLLVVLALVALVNVSVGNPAPEPSTVQVVLPHDRVRFAGVGLRAKDKATLIAMVHDSAAGDAVHPQEHAVRVKQLPRDGTRGDTIVTIDRDVDDVALDKLIDDLARSDTIYLIPARGVGRDRHGDRSLTVTVPAPPGGSSSGAPTVQQTTILSLSNCVAAVRRDRRVERPKPDPPADPPARAGTTRRSGGGRAVQSGCSLGDRRRP